VTIQRSQQFARFQIPVWPILVAPLRSSFDPRLAARLTLLPCDS
jgi:hypothetical protein